MQRQERVLASGTKVLVLPESRHRSLMLALLVRVLFLVLEFSNFNGSLDLGVSLSVGLEILIEHLLVDAQPLSRLGIGPVPTLFHPLDDLLGPLGVYAGPIRAGAATLSPRGHLLRHATLVSQV